MSYRIARTAGVDAGAGPVHLVDSKSVLHELFYAALDASFPQGKFAGRLPPRPAGRTIILGAGKAAASMAAAFEDEWGAPCEGLVITRYGHSTATRYVEVKEAGHPVPDAAGLSATTRMLDMARSAGPDDLVVFLISGGASSLMTMPIPGVELTQKQDITRQLLRSGAAISEINYVRKSLSAVKGGKLAVAAMPARTVTYVISDVPGDDPAVVGSGPSIIQTSSSERVHAILGRFEIEVPPSLRALIDGPQLETIEHDSEVHLIASPSIALRAAAARARSLGLKPLILGDAIEGEAREVGRVMAGIASSIRHYQNPVAAPCVILSGGETTVTVRGNGRGGRNAEFLLALSIGTRGLAGVSAIACDTDGIDGSENNAGAWFDETHLAASDLAEQQDHLHRNDAYTYFDSHKLLTVTGPTLTNVNDFRAILVR